MEEEGGGKEEARGTRKEEGATPPRRLWFSLAFRAQTHPRQEIVTGRAQAFVRGSGSFPRIPGKQS